MQVLASLVKSHMGDYLSGLSEAHTESISPTSNVPWKGAKIESEGNHQSTAHYGTVPRLQLLECMNQKGGFFKVNCKITVI
jgi:hypothetical protein